MIANDQLKKLIQKYDRPGPRYTSYPTAPSFTTEFTGLDYRTSVLSTELASSNPDLSLYFHFPFCDSLCYFCGCTTIITRNRERIGEYLGYLKKEAGLLAPLLNADRKVVQLHWGGGTPTYLSPTQIAEMGEFIRRCFPVADDAEMSVEIDPRDVTWHHMKALRDAGFNRVSIGVQDFNPAVQRAVNRNQSEFLTSGVIGWARELGFSSVNVDLIYGLPLQTEASFARTLEKIIGVAPDRLAVYNFAYVPWMKKQQRLIHPEDLPSPDVKLEILVNTIDTLESAGYSYLGMDHFARPGDELTLARQSHTLRRNFQGYSTKGGSDMYGLGMSAIGHFGSTYAQNHKALNSYYSSIGKSELATHSGYRMTPDDVLRKTVIMELMCDLFLDKEETGRRFGIAFDEYFSRSLSALQPLAEDGMILTEGGSLTVTRLGRLFLRNVAMCFDAHLPAVRMETKLFSRTV